MNQRWHSHRHTFRPAGELFDPRRHDVAVIDKDAEPKAFVLSHHYSASYPAARVRFGLYDRNALVGVAVFSVPCRDSVITDTVPGIDAKAGVELGRFVLLDRVAGNGETWFLGRCFAALRQREGLEAVVSFSDPVPRQRADGTLVFPGHIGTIYQAHNAVYLGRGQRRSQRLLPDGTILSARAMSKIRAGEQGWRYAARLLEKHGASVCPADPDERRLWLSLWVSRLTRLFRHGGNHRYAWALDRAAQKALSVRAVAYPKMLEAA